MAEKYTIASTEKVDGRILVQRVSDGLKARCKQAWLMAGGAPGVFVARSSTKDIKLDNLEWTTEG